MEKLKVGDKVWVIMPGGGWHGRGLPEERTVVRVARKVWAERFGRECPLPEEYYCSEEACDRAIDRLEWKHFHHHEAERLVMDYYRKSPLHAAAVVALAEGYFQWTEQEMEELLDMYVKRRKEGRV